VKRFRLPVLVLVTAFVAFAPPARGQPADESGFATLPPYGRWTGDFDELRQKRQIRILVPYSKTLYFIDKGRELGTVAELGRAFEAWLNKRHKTRSLPIHVAFVPTIRDRLIPALLAGEGDIVAANMTVTPARSQQVVFSVPVSRNVNEILVTGPASPQIASIEDLAGQPIYVRASSSYFEHLLELGETFAARGLQQIDVTPIDEELEDEDLLEMVNAGLLPYAVVDDQKATLWTQVLPHLGARPDIVLHADGETAWAVRPESPQLLAEVNAFLSAGGGGGNLVQILRRKYYGDPRLVKEAYGRRDQGKFNRLIDLFRRHGQAYGFDPLMVAAQGYQESRLDQSLRSPRGAVGVMQLLPSTAADPNVNVRGIEKSADLNILAGTKYLRFITTRYLADPAISDKDRTLMAFAAYNAGPANLGRFRRKAQALGLNPNVWFGNVEFGAAKVVGLETVQYVGNIYKYYVAYRMLVEREREREILRTRNSAAGP
jgi:membrane-bound lytic murein transglycosylase MltF